MESNCKSKAPTVSKKAPKHNCKQRSSTVRRKLPTVSKKLHPQKLSRPKNNILSSSPLVAW